jgi:hypothetical protein
VTWTGIVQSKFPTLYQGIVHRHGLWFSPYSRRYRTKNSLLMLSYKNFRHLNSHHSESFRHLGGHRIGHPLALRHLARLKRQPTVRSYLQ